MNETYTCPNCYSSVYKKQINCTKCGMQLRKPVGERKNLFQTLYLVLKIVGLIMIVVILFFFITMFF